MFEMCGVCTVRPTWWNRSESPYTCKYTPVLFCLQGRFQNLYSFLVCSHFMNLHIEFESRNITRQMDKRCLITYFDVWFVIYQVRWTTCSTPLSPQAHSESLYVLGHICWSWKPCFQFDYCPLAVHMPARCLVHQNHHSYHGQGNQDG